MSVAVKDDETTAAGRNALERKNWLMCCSVLRLGFARGRAVIAHCRRVESVALEGVNASGA